MFFLSGCQEPHSNSSIIRGIGTDESKQGALNPNKHKFKSRMGMVLKLRDLGLFKHDNLTELRGNSCSLAAPSTQTSVLDVTPILI